MVQVVIFGAGKLGLQLKSELESSKKYEICYFCDNDPKKWDMIFDNVRVLSFAQVQEMINTKKFKGILVVAAHNGIEQIVDQIRNSKIEIKLYGCTQKYLLDKSADVLYELDYSKPRLFYYEYHVAHHCNLKCKGCGHFSNLAEAEYGNLEKYIRDIKRIKELFWGVKRIRLMGGEPLLNGDLPQFIIETRKIFPDANIRVVTNGLLIPVISDTVFKSMRENAVGFDITQYVPTSRIKEKIETKCQGEGVQYIMSPLKTKFLRQKFTKGNGEANYQACISRKCHFLMDGKMSVCGIPILHEKFSDKIKQEFPLHKEDVLNLHDNRLDGFAINDFLSRPVHACEYCNCVDSEEYDWEGNYPYFME